MATPKSKQAEPVTEKAYETKYTIKELVDAAETAFKTNKVIVHAALKAAGKEAYSMDEATRIVTAFKNKEVKN